MVFARKLDQRKQQAVHVQNLEWLFAFCDTQWYIKSLKRHCSNLPTLKQKRNKLFPYLGPTRWLKDSLWRSNLWASEQHIFPPSRSVWNEANFAIWIEYALEWRKPITGEYVTHYKCRLLFWLFQVICILGDKKSTETRSFLTFSCRLHKYFPLALKQAKGKKGTKRIHAFVRIDSSAPTTVKWVAETVIYWAVNLLTAFLWRNIYLWLVRLLRYQRWTFIVFS